MKDLKTVYLVDDDSAVRHALRVFMEGMGYSVREFASAEAMLVDGSISDIGVLVLDQRMSGLTGLELQAELNRRGIESPVIFITGHGDVQMSVKAMKAGAIDFLEKPFSNQELLASVRDAFRRVEIKSLTRNRKGVIERRFRSLTPREQEVMSGIIDGLSNKNIADQMGVSSRTIEVHRSKVMKKMQAESLPELVRMAELCTPARRK